MDRRADAIEAPPDHPSGPEPGPGAGSILLLWIVLTLGLQAALWISGARPTALVEAIEIGAARVETKGIGEVGDDVVRKAIAIQHDTRAFWTVLALFVDFVIEPLLLPLRAGVVAALFAGIALLRGRSVEFGRGLIECAWAQGFWVLGLATRAALTIGLKRPEVETSAALFLSPGIYPGVMWAALQQLDVFAMLGWWAMIRCGVSRMRIGWAPALAVGLALFLFEAIVRLQGSLVIEAGMRLSLLPERM